MFLRNTLTLFELCQRFPDFGINKVVEIGVGPATDCRVKEFIHAGTDVTLVEPHPAFARDIVGEFGKYPNCKIFNCAVGPEDGTVDFYINGSSSFIDVIDKPPTVTDGGFQKQFGHKIKVPCRKWGPWVEDNPIDLLLLDMEGSEWFVIKELVSLPRIIAFESHSENRYTNARIKEINQWLDDRCFKVLFRNTSDTFVIRGNDFGWGAGNGLAGWNLG